MIKKRTYHNKIIKIGSALLMASIIFCNCTACSLSKQDSKSVSKSGTYFDTIITITLYDSDDESIIDGCFELANEYEQLLSNRIDTSDISRINQNPGQSITVDEKTADVIQEALSYCKLSNGAFDITIGALTDLWNISEIAKKATEKDNIVDASCIPSSNAINDLLPHVNYNSIIVNGCNVTLIDDKAKIDLGGIAKGYIADKMKLYLNEKGIQSGIINLGGNLLTIGPKSNGKAYKIGIQKPFTTTGETITSLDIDDSSVVTSGIYERYFKVDNKIYHHILSSMTGYPVENELYGVTIISKSSTQGDAFSTIALSLGLEEGMKFIESQTDVEAIFITNDNKIHKTSGLK